VALPDDVSSAAIKLRAEFPMFVKYPPVYIVDPLMDIL
jgi:hypothetical protein